jgi:hypothetical protein
LAQHHATLQRPLALAHLLYGCNLPEQGPAAQIAAVDRIDKEELSRYAGLMRLSKRKWLKRLIKPA